MNDIIRDVCPLYWSAAFCCANLSLQYSNEVIPDDLTVEKIFVKHYLDLQDSTNPFVSSGNMVLRISGYIDPTIIIMPTLVSESISDEAAHFASCAIVVFKIW